MRLLRKLADRVEEVLRPRGGCLLPWYRLCLTPDSFLSCCQAKMGSAVCYQPLASTRLEEEGLWSVWNGPAFREMRRRMAAGGARAACELDSGAEGGCFPAVQDGGFTGLGPLTAAQKTNRRRARRAFRAGTCEVRHFPLEIELVLDLFCPLRCVHCSQLPYRAGEGERVLRVECFRDSLVEFLRHGTRLVVLGGEPTVSPRYALVLDAVRRAQGARVRLVTNGLTIERSVLPHLDAIAEVHVSIDAASPETYEQIRRGGNWGQLLAGLEALRARRQDVFILFHNVIHPLNVSELPEMVLLAKRFGARLVRFDEVREYAGRDAADHSALLFETEAQKARLRQALERARQRAGEEGLELICTFPCLSFKTRDRAPSVA